ncbi:radical SAM protein [Candidatus Poribacteria bacterium]|jgi:putative pyruvate formate lyase activating enzyme|nr:radical SAM protein [Candidatus Poribacteria bacterium]MBT5532165.1 radical SAM protein [Candidatus Poribacteria bacterium]MBT5713398.1 radical SAM protein [Candidatus Poribacteria bacterium]MBT7101393.1 radical SAM protein [Candidatus Poribacteria bacterium]MBT7806985.1 radical SAM protein [Candidatus Poribacteria bacterium]
MNLYQTGELEARAHQAVAALAECRLCPRDCAVDRLRDERSVCWTGRYAQVASSFAHFGEEDCLRGTRGSGTIFLAKCNLRCVFCQNFDVSQGEHGEEARPDDLAQRMLDLQDDGCHNINFVTPEHVVPQLLDALVIAVARGLRLPIVYNTSAYDSMHSLRLLDGVVDIYMPDFKLWDPDLSFRYLKARDYPEVARAAVREMHRQVGPLEFDARGIATRGLLVRHLVMPGLPDETRAILEFLADEIHADTYVNVMAQYRPAGKVSAPRYEEIARAPRHDEWGQAVAAATDLGLRADTRQLSGTAHV